MISKKRSNFSKSTKQILPTAFALSLLLPTHPAAGARNPHAFMKEPAGCMHCHYSQPVKPGEPFVKDIVSICSDCHPVVHRMSHPVDIRPLKGAGLNLPLDSEGTITCATCHDPHSNTTSSTPYLKISIIGWLKGLVASEGYSTSFLRMPNTRGQLCLSCHRSDELKQRYPDISTEFDRDYTGSHSCRNCHEEIYREWEKTPHARTISNLSEKSDAIRAAFSEDKPFNPQDVEMVIGVHWTQRFVIDRNGILKVARGVWSLTGEKWTESVGREQSWREHCAGCHLTGYDPYRDSYVEKGIGCEICHGPGGQHVRYSKKDNIVNPARLKRRLRISICASCHTDGHDRTGEFRYPVGFIPGRSLDNYYRGLLPRAGQGEDTYKGDGTIEDRLRSFGFWVEKFLQPGRILSRRCKNPHVKYASDEIAGDEDLTKAQYCLSCHNEMDLDAVHRFEVEDDLDCNSCHPSLKNGLGQPSIHDHKFVFRY